MTERLRATAGTQIRVLSQAFATRFFENEVTSSSRDLRSSFFWLIALLAQPGFIIPMLMVFEWSVLAFQGFDALRIGSWDEKTVYLGYSMTAAGVLAAVVWGALLLDRRDALVLGVMPTTGPRLVAAKLIALVAYAGVVFIGMHLVGAGLFGAMLAGRDGADVALRGMTAHLVASVLASGTVLIGAAALQGVFTVVVGHARFTRISSPFQMAVTIAALVNLLTIVPVIRALSLMIRTHGDAPPDWVMWVPVAWFLGVYEVMLGAPEPFLHQLARTALIAFGTVCLVTVVCQPLAFRTLVRSLIEQSAPAHGQRRSTRGAQWLAEKLGAHSGDRGVMEFALLTVLRVDSHRLTIAMGLGAAAAWSLPMVAARLGADDPVLRASAFGAPLAMTTFVLVALRTALTMPGDLRASWVFEMMSVPPERVRASLRRLLLALAVVPTGVFGVALVWVDAGVLPALWSGAVSGLTGWLLVEACIWQWAVVPAASVWKLSRANLQATWPLYLGAFVVLTVVIPRIALSALDSPLRGVLLVVVLVAIAVTLARTGTSPAVMQSGEDELVTAPRLDV